MKNLLFALLFAAFFTGSAQAQLNDYKYIIVPKKFDEFKKENQHLTSTLVKHLFVQYGFTAVYEDALPEDLNNDRCLGLTAHLKDESSMFSTKASIVLKDCKLQEVYSTQQGTSKQKDFKVSYGEALREAFMSLEGIGYAYEPTETPAEPVTVSFKNDVKQLDKAETVKQEEKDIPEVKVEEKTAMVQQEATPENQSYKNLEPKPSDVKKAEPDPGSVQNTALETTDEVTDIWYAQPITSGYQLVDSTPKVRLKLFKTSVANVYLAQNEKGDGLVYQKNGRWFLEYYEGNNLVTEELNIKF